MEHRPTFLPPASSSAQAFGSPVFLMSSVQARAFDKLRGEAEIRGFPSYRGKDEAEDEAASSASSHGYPETEANASSGDEKKLSKRTSEKKIPTPKYAFQTRSHMDILDDGYRWRKYGQKAVKNNRFPRSYYRCTHQGCNVKKQVQRLSKDEGVVVTTYEGTHIHPIEKTSDNFERILSQMRIFTDL